MNYDEFVNLVKKRARLDSDQAAEAAIEATLSTLGERILSTEAQHLAAQLPFEVGRHLTEQDTQKEFDLEQFYLLVSQRESTGFPMAQRHTQAVMSVVSEIVSPGELEDVLSQLPDEYIPLFTFSSTQWRDL